MKKLEERMESIEFPFLALHGDADAICDVQGSKMLYDKAKSEDKEIKVKMLFNVPVYIHIVNVSNFLSKTPDDYQV